MDEERVAHQRVSRRTSVTVLPLSMRSSAPSSARSRSTTATPLGHVGVGQHLHHQGLAAADSHPAAGLHTEAVEVVGVGPEARCRSEGGQGGAGLDQGPLVVQAVTGDEAEGVAVGRGYRRRLGRGEPHERGGRRRKGRRVADSSAPGCDGPATGSCVSGGPARGAGPASAGTSDATPGTSPLAVGGAPAMLGIPWLSMAPMPGVAMGSMGPGAGWVAPAPVSVAPACTGAAPPGRPVPTASRTGTLGIGATIPSAARGSPIRRRVMPACDGATRSISSQMASTRVHAQVGPEAGGQLGGDHPVGSRRRPVRRPSGPDG